VFSFIAFRKLFNSAFYHLETEDSHFCSISAESVFILGECKILASQQSVVVFDSPLQDVLALSSCSNKKIITFTATYVSSLRVPSDICKSSRLPHSIINILHLLLITTCTVFFIFCTLLFIQKLTKRGIMWPQNMCPLSVLLRWTCVKRTEWIFCIVNIWLPTCIVQFFSHISGCIDELSWLRGSCPHWSFCHDQWPIEGLKVSHIQQWFPSLAPWIF